MRRVQVIVAVIAGVVLVAGCSDEVKKSEPKLSGGATSDPRLKPESTGAVSSPKAALKGD